MPAQPPVKRFRDYTDGTIEKCFCQVSKSFIELMDVKLLGVMSKIMKQKCDKMVMKREK